MRLNEKNFLGLPVALWAMVIVYGVIISLFSLTRFYEFKTSIVDLTAYTQSFWNYVQGNGWAVTTAPPHVEQNPFGHHFTPFFYLLLPVFALFPYAETFQLIQAWAYAFAAIPVFLAVRQLGYSATAACVWVIIFLLNPFTLNAAVWDFHETCISTLVISWLMWAIAARKRNAMLAFALLLLGCKEHFGIAVAGAGLLWGIRTREWKLGGFLFAGGLAACAIIILKVVPSFNPTGKHLMLTGQSETLDRFGWLLDPLNHGEVIFALMFADLFYAFFLLVPLLGWPLRAFWWILPAGADLAVNMLSGNGFLRSVGSYHTAPIIPVLVIAAAAGLANYTPKEKRLSRKEVLGAILITTLLFGYGFAPLPIPGAANGWEIGQPQLHYPANEQQAINDIHAIATPDIIIAAQSNIGALFAKRRGLYTFPYALDNVQMVVLRLKMPFANIRNYYGNPFTSTGPEPLHEAYTKMLDSGQWHVRYVNEPWVVLERGAVETDALRPQTDALWEKFLKEFDAIEMEALPF